MSSSDNPGVQLPSSSRPSPSPRSPQGRRRPLQERTTPQPTIRIVGDSDPKTAYDKSPFPSQPSHILSPSRYGQGSHTNDQGHDVSASDSPANRPRAVSQRVASMVANFEALTPKALEPRSSNRNSSSTKNSRNSAASTLTLGAPFTPASSRFSQGTTPPTSPLSNLRQSKHDSLASTNILSAFEDDEDDQATTPTAPTAPAGLGSPAPIAPVAPAAATIRPVIPSGSYPDPTKFSQDPEPENEFARPVYPSASTALTESIRRPSEASTADCNRTYRTSDTPTPPSSAADGSWLSRAWESLSIASDDTAIYRKPAGHRDFSGSTVERRPPESEPHTSSSSSPGALSEFSVPNSQKTTVHHPRSRSDHLGSTRVSNESLYSPPSTRGSNTHSRSSSSPAPNWSLHPALEVDENGSPDSSVVPRPSLNSPWGESRPLPKNKTRMQGRSDNWSSNLSTIDSASEPRTSQSLSSTLTLGLGGHRKRQSLGSIDYLTSGAEPTPSPGDHANPAAPRLIIPSETQTRRDKEQHGEGDDTLGELNALPLRSQRSGLLRTLSLDSSRPSSSHSARSSYTTHFLDTVPAWARYASSIL
ncbi:uncharacterized protein K452DRAFT_103259 [Aplosporella prunicola CBS 121167]|uniref:Uncharacterized protein n=1 Tax=Aplosporella prunicola CBS 121167 TaxID=1176127 RepID=A0A6A6BRL0_9PEZI|nr:uncharacterized protein K452DRAFT_103259 [Aplosporella prunicola CBS 121167]KAF2145925.1 hypothetical protein K452DRAFT_103259 [Aplosporella prunicola CBS 121167]